MTKNKKRIIIIVSVVVLLLIIILLGVLVLYLKTDMFKSNKTLFMKYISKNINNVQEISKGINNKEYTQSLEGNKYTTDSEIKVSYVEGIGTTSEGAKNPINELKININEQTDKTNNYKYSNAKLLNNDEQIMGIEYSEIGELYGIKFSDLFSQFIVFEKNEDENSQEESIEVNEFENEKMLGLYKAIENQNIIEEILSLSEEEQQTINSRYANLLINNLKDSDFYKKANETIQIDGNNFKTNAYILKLKKEQLNNLIINILEQIKQDDIILRKVEEIQNKFLEYNLIDSAESMDLKSKFQENIDEKINDIISTNIGQEETSITVYENNQELIRTKIITTEIETNIDWLMNYSEKDYLKITNMNTNEEKEETVEIIKTNEEVKIDVKETKERETTSFSFSQNEKIEGNACIKNINFGSEDSKNRVGVSVYQKLNIENDFSNKIAFDESNSIRISKLEQTQMQEVLSRVILGVQGKVEEISNIITLDDVLSVLEAAHVITKEQRIEANGITETEKNRFNSQFEILQGENQSSENIITMIDAVKNNLINIEVVSSTKLRLELDRNKKNDEIAAKIVSFVEKDKYRKYNVSLEYDETTGLVKYIALEIVTNT